MTQSHGGRKQKHRGEQQRFRGVCSALWKQEGEERRTKDHCSHHSTPALCVSMRSKEEIKSKNKSEKFL